MVLGIAAIAAGPIMSRVEQPEYKLTTSNGAIEVRDYGPMIVAEAEVVGELQVTVKRGAHAAGE